MLAYGSLKAQHLPVFEGFNKDSVYIFFSQIDYKLPIALNTADPSYIEVKSKGGQVVKLNDTLYQVRFNTPGEETKVKLYYKNFPIGIITANVTNVTVPEIRLDGSTSRTISHHVLNKLKRFEVAFSGQDLRNAPFEFFTCKLTIREPGKPEPFSLNLRNLDFPDQLQMVLAKLPIHSVITFEEFKIKTLTNNVLNVEGQPVVFNVIE